MSFHLMESAPPKITTSFSPIADQSTAAIPLVELVKFIPEEKVWLYGLKTANTRRAYQRDVAHFIFLLGFSSSEDLYSG